MQPQGSHGVTGGRHALRPAPGLDSLVAGAPRGSTDGAGSTDGGGATTGSTGEVELVDRVRTGDDDALLTLVQRHRGALERAGADVTVDSLARAGRAAAVWLRATPHPLLPFRAALLATHLRGEVPALPLDEPLWRGYAALPAAARIALWHREVEGDRPGRIATLLQTDGEEIADALESAYASLRRRVALEHPVGAGADCRRWAELFRFSPPAHLSREQATGLTEHGHDCAACRPLTVALLGLDRDLARTLARPVLGPLTDGYLAARPRRVRLVRRHSADRPGAVPSHRSARRPRTLRAGGSFSLVGAGSIALLLATPGTIHPVDPQTLPPAPGAVVRPAGESGSATGRTRAGDATGPRDAARQAGRRGGAGGAGGAADGAGSASGNGSGAVGGGQPGSGGSGNGDGGSGPDAPTTDGGPTSPTPTEPTPAPTDPAPPAGSEGDSGLLDVDLGEGGVSVTVDPQLPSGPIEVELPLPIDLSGLPDLPAVPHLPGSPVSGSLQPGLG